MEEKKPINIRLSTAILTLIILILIGGIVYFVYQNNMLKSKQAQSEEELKNLQSKTTQELQNLQNKTQELQKTIDETKNITTNTITAIVENTKQNTSTQSAAKKADNEKKQYAENYKNKSDDTTKKEDKYKKITKSLNGEDGLFVTDVEINNNQYTLKGVIYKEIPNVHPEWQISSEWKLTEEYRQITVNGNIPFSSEFLDEDKTVSEIFKNWKNRNPKAETNPNPIYKFKFENGKCVRVSEVLTSI